MPRLKRTPGYRIWLKNSLVLSWVGFSKKCSDQRSYNSIAVIFIVFEYLNEKKRRGGKDKKKMWYARQDSNLRSSAPEADALSPGLRAHNLFVNNRYEFTSQVRKYYFDLLIRSGCFSNVSLASPTT